MLKAVGRIESLIARVTVGLIVFFCIVSVLAVVMLGQYGKPGDSALRMAIPISVIASSMAALFLLRRSRPRTAAGVVIITAYLAILYYVIGIQYGLHSYLLSVLALLIMMTSLLIGPRAGLWAAAAALAIVLALYFLERAGYVVDMKAVHAVPLAAILVVYCLLYASAGSVLYVYSRVFQDTLHAADEQEKRVRQLIDVSPLAQVVHRHNRVLMINRAAAAVTGRDPDALTGQEIDAFVSRRQREHLQQRMKAAQALLPGQNLVEEYRIRDSAGQWRLFETLTAPVQFVDGAALLTVMRDVTAEREAAAALVEAKREAEAANRAKSQFLANMSHEIRTPMHAVLGLSDVLTGAGLTGTQLKYAQSIHAAAGSLLDLINDVLDVSRIEAGHLELVAARLEPRLLLAQLKAMLLPLAEAKGLAFEVQVAPGVPACVVGDEGRLRQILVNLAGNAIKFTEQGRVAVEVEAADSTEHHGDASRTTARDGNLGQSVELRITVTDTGIGIAPDKLDTLFERFTQLDDSDTRRHGGTGLGLYIARELVDLMGGRIAVSSIPGVGTRFDVALSMRLPSAEEERSPARVDASQSTRQVVAAAPLSLLVVEDNEINRMVARAILERAGHRVAEACDGAEALKLTTTQTFDMILMDIQMPVMDGIEATRQIRQRESAAGKHTPIIALSANAMRGDRERYLASGMDAFLAKPYESADLLAVLAQATGATQVAAAPGRPQRSAPGAADNAAEHQAADSEASDEPHFDPRGIEGLVRLDADSPGLLCSLVSRFLADTPRLIAQVAADDAVDVKAMEIAAHSLKGNARRFGARHLAQLAEQAERAARDGATQEAAALGGHMRTEYGLFEAEFKRHPAVTGVIR